jgi:hypothetical protein
LITKPPSGSGGFVINGKDTSSQGQSGRAVSSAGDVNGDGLDDLVIGAFGSDPVETGKVFVVFGKKDDTSANGLSAIESCTGYHIRFTFVSINTSDICPISTNNQITQTITINIAKLVVQTLTARKMQVDLSLCLARLIQMLLSNRITSLTIDNKATRARFYG